MPHGVLVKPKPLGLGVDLRHEFLVEPCHASLPQVRHEVLVDPLHHGSAHFVMGELLHGQSEVLHGSWVLGLGPKCMTIVRDVAVRMVVWRPSCDSLAAIAVYHSIVSRANACMSLHYPPT